MTILALDAETSALGVVQSAEYDKRVPNISHFVYIGSPGLHPNRRQDLVATRLYRQYRHSPDTSRHLAYINIYIYNIIFPIKHISSIYFGTEGPNV